MATLQEWLARFQNAGKRKDFPLLTLGTGLAFIWKIPVHPILGDYSSGTWEMVASDVPGDSGTTQATFTVVAGTAANSIVPITASLLASDQGSITAPGAPDYETELPAAMYYTPSGGGREIMRAGLLPINAGVPA